MKHQHADSLIKALIGINILLNIVLYLIRPDSYITLTGLLITQLVFAYSYLKHKRMLTIPLMIAYFIYFIIGVIDGLLKGGITQGNNALDTVLLIAGNIAVLAVGYYTYKKWIKGTW